MKNYFLIFVLLFLSLPSLAQSLLLKGYYINLQGEKLVGKFQINLKFPDNADSLIFHQNNQTKIIFKKDIQSLFLDHYGYYKRRIFSLPDGLVREDLIEVLIDGDVSLYYHPGGNVELFWVESSQNPIQLIAEKISSQELNTPIKKNKAPYKNILNYYLRKCPELQKEIQKTKVYMEPMVGLLKNYNTRIMGDSFFIQKTSKKLLWEMGPIFRIGKTGFAFNGNDVVGRELKEIEFTSTKDLGLGVYGNFFRSKWKRNSGLRGYLLLQFTDLKSTGIYTSSGTFTYEYSDMAMSFASMNLGIMYTQYLYLNNKINVNFELGPYVEIPLNPYINFTGTETLISGSGSVRHFNTTVTHNSNVGVLAGAALSFNIGNNKSLSIFSQFSGEEVIVFSEGSLAYKISGGLRADIF